jgi:hypothetical protein
MPNYPVATLGLIAGNGRFPLLVAEEARRQGRAVVAAAIEGETDPALADRVDRLEWMKLGQIKKTLAFLKEHGAEEAVMAGQVRHVSIFDLRHLDATAVKLFATLPNKKTDTLLGAVADEFARHGIRFQSSVAYLSHLLAPEGPLTSVRPTAAQKRDIDFGFKTAKALGGLDLGQTVCVKDQAVLAIEAMEGTDACILRAGGFAPGFTVAKVAKPRQDLRFDVPVIGGRTLDALREAKAAVLAVEAGKTLLFDKDEFLSGAGKAGIAVVGVRGDA